MANQKGHALLPSSCSRSTNVSMNAQGPGKKQCVGTRSTGDARSSFIVGKTTSGYLQPIHGQNATVHIVAIDRSTGLAPETEGQNRSAGIGATKMTSALPCVIGWGAEVTDMIGRRIDAMIGRGAGLIGMTGQKTKPAFTADSKRWPMLG